MLAPTQKEDDSTDYVSPHFMERFMQVYGRNLDKSWFRLFFAHSLDKSSVCSDCRRLPVSLAVSCFANSVAVLVADSVDFVVAATHFAPCFSSFYSLHSSPSSFPTCQKHFRNRTFYQMPCHLSF